MSAARVRVIEGVEYHPHEVRFRLRGGRRFKRTYWSPGEPWVGTEVVRALGDEFGYENIVEGIKIKRVP